jgi:UDP-glucose 4-epimerase
LKPLQVVLITGGAGFIGTHLTRALLEKGVRVTVIDRAPSPEFLKLKSGKLTLIHSDLFNCKTLKEEIQKVEVVFHLAAQPSIQVCENDREAATRDNLISTELVLEHLKDTASQHSPKRIVFTSTSAVYGDVKFAGSISENLPCDPISHYGQDKLRSEKAIFTAVEEEQSLSASVFRLFNVYGLGQKKNSPYSGVITKFADWYHQNSPLTLYGDGNQVRDFIHVSDIARGLIAGAEIERPYAKPFNLGSGHGTKVIELAQLFLNRKPLGVKNIPSPPNEIVISVGNADLAKERLNWSAKIRLETGIAEFLN